MSNIITLLTDFGLNDCYVGVMKGVIKSINPLVEIIDITHQVTRHNILEGAYVLKSSYKFFPVQTIHTIVIDPGVGSERQSIVAKSANYYFVAPNNGLLSYLVDEEELEAYSISNPKYFLSEVSTTFHGRDIFAPVAAHLSRGIPPKEFGERAEIVKLTNIKAKISSEVIEGEVIYIDRFGNLITNIMRRDVKFPSLEIEVKGYKIPTINQYYAQSKAGELLAIWGSSNHLEVSVNLGSAKDFLGAECGEKVVLRRRR
jgi:hypothetical protein